MLGLCKFTLLAKFTILEILKLKYTLRINIRLEIGPDPTRPEHTFDQQ